MYILLTHIQVTHQLFRRIETFYIPTHVFLVLAPPTLTTALLFDRSFPLSTLSQLSATSIATFLAALVLSIVLYRVSPFHPLARFPGPTWRKVTMLVPAYQSISGNRHKQIDELHRKYGDVVRTGPSTLRHACGPIRVLADTVATIQDPTSYASTTQS